MKKIYYAFVLVLIFISSCKKDVSLKNESSSDLGKTITYNLKNGGQVTVFISKNGEYIFGGDVVLSKEQIAYLEYNKIGSTVPRSTFTSEFQKLWPSGIVYYTINDVGNSSDIQSAIAHWEANTPIRLSNKLCRFCWTA